ncbi:MAG: FtsW/RodA/SpoVE family cell cycle protein [Syntrophomonadaceae bacterium]
MSLYQNHDVTEYLEKVCDQVKCKEIHPALKSELLNHIEERSEDLLAQGVPPEEAIRQAVKDMGDPVSVGKQLHQTHKPKTDWWLLLFTALFLGFGLFTLYTIQFNNLLTYDLGVFYKSIFYAVLGGALLILVSRIDYRKFQPISAYVYVFTIGIWILTLLDGPSVAGLPYLVVGPFSINIAAISPYLLTIALAGLLVKCDWNDRKSLIKGGILFIIPVLLYIASPCLSGLLLFTSAFFVLMLLSRAKYWQIAAIMAFPVLTTLLAVISHPYRLQRFTIFLNPQVDPSGAGYLYIKITEVLKAAGLFGQGFNLSVLPELHTDFVFTYIVYTFGWLAGILFFFLVVGFLVHLFKTAKIVRNEYGSLLIAGLSTLLLVQTLWHILMNLGWLPITGMSLPFISYGGSQLVVQMLALGMILAAYRLKDIVLLTNK